MRRRVHTTSHNNNCSSNLQKMNQQELKDKMCSIIDIQMNQFKQYMTQKLLVNFSKQKMVNYIEEFEREQNTKKLTQKKTQKTNKKKIQSQSFVSNKSFNKKVKKKKKLNLNESVLLPSKIFQRKKTKKKIGVRSMVNSPNISKKFKSMLRVNKQNNIQFSFKKKAKKIFNKKKSKQILPKLQKRQRTPQAPLKNHQCQCKQILLSQSELQSQRQMERYLNGNFNQIQEPLEEDLINDFQPQTQSQVQSIRKSTETESEENIFQKSYEQIDVQSQSIKDDLSVNLQEVYQFQDFDQIEKNEEDRYEIKLKESCESSQSKQKQIQSQENSKKRLTFGQNNIKSFQQFANALDGRQLSLTNLSEVIQEEEILSEKENYIEMEDYQDIQLKQSRDNLQESLKKLKNSFESQQLYINYEILFLYICLHKDIQNVFQMQQNLQIYPFILKLKPLYFYLNLNLLNS